MDFAQMDLQEIRDNITRRRNKIFLLMEEVRLFQSCVKSFVPAFFAECTLSSFHLQVRRLRIQHKIKSTEKGIEDVAENEEVPEYTSAIPLLAPMVCFFALV
jgi:hypothetical protein